MQDIVNNVRLIGTYTDDFDFETFARSQLVNDAVERCLSRISEAAVKLGSIAEDLLPHHNWKAIRNLGNLLRHEYDHVDESIIWSIVSINLLPLIHDIQNVIPQLPDDK